MSTSNALPQKVATSAKAMASDTPAQNVAEPGKRISLKEALAKLQADANAKSSIKAEFAESFPELAALKNEGISIAKLLGYVKKWMPNLHHSQFKAMFDAELKRRLEQGEEIDCEPYGRARNLSSSKVSAARATADDSAQTKPDQSDNTEATSHLNDEVGS
jgi:hypothetical protein